MKLKDILNESQHLDYKRMNVGEEEEKGMTNEEKREFLKAVSEYKKFGESIYRSGNLAEVYESIKNIVETAQKVTLEETGDWFDKVTVNRHMKSMNESFKVFSNTIKEVNTLQQRLESCYDEMGEVLGKYYEIKEGNEFGAERAKAIAAGEDEFEVDGKKFPVTDVDSEDKENAKDFAKESVNEAGIFGKVFGKKDKSDSDQETFTATNKETGNVSTFKSKANRDAAVKAGTHEAPGGDAKSDEPKKEPKESKPINWDRYTMGDYIPGKISSDFDNGDLSPEDFMKVVTHMRGKGSLVLNRKEANRLEWVASIERIEKDRINNRYFLKNTARETGETPEEVKARFEKLRDLLAANNESVVVNESKYTVINPKTGNVMGQGMKDQAAKLAKKMGGEKMGYFVIPVKNALKARRALEKFNFDVKNPKLKDIMSDLYFEEVEGNKSMKLTSIMEGYSTEEKRIVLMAVKKIMKYMNVDIKTAMMYVLGAGQELERDIEKGKVK